jgi:hypothetical protein
MVVLACARLAGRDGAARPIPARLWRAPSAATPPAALIEDGAAVAAAVLIVQALP